MPINREDLLSTANQNVGDLLQKRKAGIGGDIAKTRTGIQERQGRILGGVPTLQGTRPDLGRSEAKLGREGRMTDASLKLQTSRSMETALFNEAMRIAGQFNMSRMQSENFARQYITDFRKRQFEGNQKRLEREHKLKLSDIDQNASTRLRQIAEQYGGVQNMTKQQIADILGSAASIATTAYATRKPSTPKNPFYETSPTAPDVLVTDPTTSSDEFYFRDY